jgi:cbb3-type cytochrome oxidase subunit 3
VIYRQEFCNSIALLALPSFFIGVTIKLKKKKEKRKRKRERVIYHALKVESYRPPIW